MSPAPSTLFVTVEGGGNVPAVLGAVRRAVACGHDVRVLSEPCLRAPIEGVGARFVPFTGHFVRTSRSEPLFLDWQASSPPEALRRSLRDVMVGPAQQVASDVLAELDREPADALVVDWLLPGGLIAGEARGVPTAVLFHCVSMLPAPGRPLGPFPPAQGWMGRWRDRAMAFAMGRIVAPFTAEFNAARAAAGLAPLDSPLDQYPRADRCLYQTLEAFDFPATDDPCRGVYVGPVLDEPDWVSDTPWTSPFAPDDTRPLVLLSLSSTFQDQRATLQAAIDALGRLDVRALVTLGPAMAEERFDAAPHVHLVPSAPHGAVLPHVDVFISHGGHGSVMRALAHGVPLVVLPMGRDQDGNAVRIVARGLGVQPRVRPQAIASAVTKVLGEPGYRARARAFGELVRAAVEADLLAGELGRLAGSAGRARVADG